MCYDVTTSPPRTIEWEQGCKMFDLKWSSSEKRIARNAYDEAQQAATASLLAELRRRANAATSWEELWAVESWLREQRKECFEMFDFRYSRLPLVFARVIREGYMDEERLAGLSEDKLKLIRSLGSFAAKE